MSINKIFLIGMFVFITEAAYSQHDESIGRWHSEWEGTISAIPMKYVEYVDEYHASSTVNMSCNQLENGYIRLELAFNNDILPIHIDNFIKSHIGISRLNNISPQSDEDNQLYLAIEKQGCVIGKLIIDSIQYNFNANYSNWGLSILSGGDIDDISSFFQSIDISDEEINNIIITRDGYGQNSLHTGLDFSRNNISKKDIMKFIDHCTE